MEKSPEAFRTISEVAEWLDVPTHVLRFWESRFSQVKPVKRAGGRRYYRPTDMTLIGGIKKLLHDDGMTIRGVQKLLREEGVRHVQSFSQPLDHEEETAIEAAPVPEEAEGESEVISLVRQAAAARPEPVPEEAPAQGSLSFGSVRSRESADRVPDRAAARIPETPEIPESDAPDDDPRHETGPGLVARLLVRQRELEGTDPIRIEDVVARLRAARDRT